MLCQVPLHTVASWRGLRFVILTPGPPNEISEWGKGVDQARTCFYLLKDVWVREKKKRKETKTSHHCRSHDVLRVCSLSRVVEDVMGWALLAVGLAVPFMPYDGPLQLGQELLPGRECPASHDVHVLHCLCFSLRMVVIREGGKVGRDRRQP